MKLADFIQSKIELFHTVKEPSPTQPEKPTSKGAKPKKIDSLEDLSPKIKDDVLLGRGRAMVGRYSMVRRSYNIIETTGRMIADAEMEHDINRAVLSGDSRKATSLRNKQQIYNAGLSGFRQLTMGAITAVATGQPLILLTQVLQTTLQQAYNHMNYLEQMRVLAEQREREIDLSRRRQERLIYQTYRR